MPDRVFDIIGGITTVALVTTILMHKNTSVIIAKLGSAYSDSIRAAMGS